MTTFTYDVTDGNVSFEGLNASDTLNITGGISDQDFSFLKDDDDLLIYTSAGTTIRLTNHFVNTTSQIETINVAEAGTIDLTNPNIIISDGNSHTLYGDNNDNLILGGNVFQNEIIYAYDGNDIIYGGDDADSIYVGTGDDVAYGGNGNDEFYDGGSGDDEYHGGEGVFDRILYRNNTQGIVVDMTAQTVDDDGDGNIDDTFTGIESITGSEYDDVITGDDSRNSLIGLDGDDNLNGGGGDDNLNGGDGDDTLYGGLGRDTLNGGTGVNYLYGEDGNDTFTSRSDFIGFDYVDGGSGQDKLLFFNSHLTNVNVNLGAGTADVDFDGIADMQLTSIEDVDGGALNDIITGDGNTNDLKGNDGNDTLNGEGGHDVVRGEKGNDTLYGSEGSDLLYGGQGADLFIFDDIDDYENGANIVADFNPNEDVLDVSNILDDTALGGILGFLFNTDNFIEAVDNGTDTIININTSGFGANDIDVVTIEGYTGHGHTYEDMVNEGYLVI